LHGWTTLHLVSFGLTICSAPTANANFFSKHLTADSFIFYSQTVFLFGNNFFFVDKFFRNDNHKKTNSIRTDNFFIGQFRFSSVDKKEVMRLTAGLRNGG